MSPRPAALRRRLFDAVDAVLNTDDVTDLERLQVLHQLQQHLTGEAVPAAVQSCMDHGETWQAVADAMGLRSRQAAQQQWGRRLTARRLI